MKTFSLLLGVGLCAMAGQAAAQGAATTQATDQTATPVHAQGPVHAHGGVQDVVTTATKVETKLQKNPQTVTTLQESMLLRQGVSNLQQLSKLASGLQVDQTGASSSFYIRGVGTRVLGGNTDPAVAFSVDGVYYAGTTGTSSTLFDISRIEIVKGPQGTLYGRNATGGAVNVLSNHPVLGARSMEGEVEIGNYQAVRSIVAVNLPIGDTLALRIAGQSVYHKGYLSDGYNDDNTKAGRVSLLYKPHDGFSLFVSGDYAHQGGMGPSAVPVGPGAAGSPLTTRFAVPDAPYTGPSDPRVNAVLHAATPASAIPYPAAGTYCVAATVAPVAAGANPRGTPAVPLCGYPVGIADQKADGYLNSDYYGGNVTADADVGIGRLTVVGGYRGTKQDARFSPASTPIQLGARINQESGELRLASKSTTSPLKWLVGAFYLREQQRNLHVFVGTNNANVPNPFPAPGSTLPATLCVAPLSPNVPGLCVSNANVLAGFDITNPSIINETAAGFAQATYAVVPWLRLTGGIRYTHDNKVEAEGGAVTSVYTIPAGATSAFPASAQVTSNKLSYRAGFDVDLAANSLLFGTYSTAFHAGGFNLGVRQGPNTFEYQPEKVTSYAVGIKNRFFDNRVQFNVEAFWLDYANYQHDNIGYVNDGSVACSQLNILATCPVFQRVENADKARIRGVEAGFVFAPGANTTINLNALYNDAKFVKFEYTNGLTGQPINYDGRRLPGTTPLTITGGINQAFPLANGARLIADARSQYKHGAYLWYDYTPGNYQAAYTRTDLSLTYEAPGARLSVTGFVRNVENKATLMQGAATDASTGVVWANLNPPRTFGGIIGFKY